MTLLQTYAVQQISRSWKLVTFSTISMIMLAASVLALVLGEYAFAAIFPLGYFGKVIDHRGVYLLRRGNELPRYHYICRVRAGQIFTTGDACVYGSYILCAAFGTVLFSSVF
jgi:hypothetical protein